MTVSEEGGTPAEVDPASRSLVVRLATAGEGTGGAVWSLPHGGDLDANLVRLDPHADIGSHTNDEVDVLVIVQSGELALVVDDHRHELEAGDLAHVARGAARSVSAGPDGASYLSVHRRRGPLSIAAPSRSAVAATDATP